MSDGAANELDRAQARVGQVLKEKWTLDRLLGVGGMGAVYAATHRNKKRGAVKILHAELSSEAAIRQRFLREGYVANSVGHQGAVEVFDDDIAEDGSAYLVMELLEGESVEHRWDRKGRRLPAREVLAIVDQLLETLAAAHAKDVVHRDLKPENLFLQKGGVLKVLDFGIARLRETGKAATATQTGSAMGTPAFMAPEQARGRWDEVDNRTDLWAVGASMFTLLTGTYVHGSAGTVNEIMARAITQPAASLASQMPSADPALVAFVDKALAYQSQDRFQDALEMQAALRDLYHSLDAKPELRAVQPSINDSDIAPSTGDTQLIAPTASSERGAVAARAASNATLTTGRPLVTSSAESAPSRTPLPKWVPLAGAGGAVVLVVLVIALSSGGHDQPAAGTSFPSAVAEASAAPSSQPTPTIASEAASPAAATPSAIDISSLPKLKTSAQAPVTPVPALKSALNKPDAASQPKPSSPPPPATVATPVTAAPPANLFKKRQ
jgi:serine/threonine-protein kinase